MCTERRKRKFPVRSEGQYSTRFEKPKKYQNIADEPCWLVQMEDLAFHRMKVPALFLFGLGVHCEAQACSVHICYFGFVNVSFKWLHCMLILPANTDSDIFSVNTC